MLKHMPPGPATGLNRPTRGLSRSQQQLHQQQQQQQQQHQQQQQQQQQQQHLHQPLNVSTLTALSGQCLNSNNITANSNKIIANGGPRMNSILNTTPLTSVSSSNNQLINKDKIGAREALTSLGLLCLVSLLLALLSLIFLLKISPGGREPPPPPPPGPTSPEDYAIVYDVTLALCALSLSLNLCCLLVCAIQFLFAVKLVRAPVAPGRGNKYLQKSSVSRVCAVGGFFISIPIFLTGIILYTFTQFQSTPAIITSVLIGVGIVFCGGAMVHNVFVWQKEKTICVRQAPLNLNLTLTPQLSTITPPIQFLNHNSHMNHNSSNNNNNNNNNNMNNNKHTANHTPLTHTSQISHTTGLTPVTPLSPNHSHVSFNHSYIPIPPTYGVHRAATATPPTPKVGQNLIGNGGRDVSGSVSPGTGNLDLSNVGNTTNSPHELSTLV